MNKTNRLTLAGIFLSLTAIIFAPLAHAQVFVSVPGNNTILQFTAAGVSTPFASGLNSPEGLTFDSAGFLYVANGNAGTIVKFPSVPTPGVSQTGTAYFSGLFTPIGLVFNNAGLLYVANANGSTIRTYPGGSIFASTGLNIPYGMTFDTSSNLYVANGGNNIIVMLPASGSPPLLTGGGLSSLRDVAWRGGILYVAGGGSTNSTIFQSTGSGYSIGTYHPSIFTGVNDPRGLAFDSAGNLYVSTGGGTLTKFDSNGNVLWTTNTGSTLGYIAVQSECAPGVMTIAQYAGVTVAGSIGCTYEIDYTTNLNNPITWTPLNTNTLTSNPYLFIDTNVISGSRFYRAVVQ
jgi:hypothetical protein